MNKQMTAAQVVAQLHDGMTIGIGGWGPRRKPMALVREILRSDLKDLTVVSYGGADVGMLCAAGKVKKVVFAFVSLDFIPLEPYFRQARQAGAIEVMEIDEGMMLLGLRAASWGMPFIPTEVGLGTDIITKNPGIKVIDSPYDDKEWVAMPALQAGRVAAARRPRGRARRVPDRRPRSLHGRLVCARRGQDLRVLRRTGGDRVFSRSRPGAPGALGALHDHRRDPDSRRRASHLLQPAVRIRRAALQGLRRFRERGVWHRRLL